ncbi:MAG: flagellar hook-length control protein FliK [Pedobacter sp.]
MEVGQIMMQGSTGTASTGSEPASADMAAVSAGKSSDSVFAGKLREMSSSNSGTAAEAVPDAATKGKTVAADSGGESKDSKPADANSDIMAALLAMFGTQEQLAAGTQIVLPTGGNDGMSESGQKVETQDVGKNLPQLSVRLVGEVAISTKQGQPVELSQNVMTTQKADSMLNAGLEQLDASSTVKSDPAIGVLEAGGIKTETEEDGTLIHCDTATIKKNMESESPVITKVCSSSTPENELLDDDGKDTSDNGMNGQFHQPATHQQLKVDTGISLGGTSGTDPKAASQPDMSENVFLQVKEVLVNRTIKAGNEQITMKLSPEHLGELTINFKMENQHLRVEIVAANRGVRDALMQQSENLKESLARQNINMESFDVVTSGGQRGFEQNDRGWKQLAQQQFMAGTSDGRYRYRVPEVDVGVVPQYGMQKQYAMVDVHY